MGHQQGGGAEVGLGAPRISNKPKLGSEVSKSTLTYTWRCTGVTGLLLSSVQFSRSVVSNSFRPHKLQHAGPPCPSQTPGVHPNPCPLSRWCLQPSHPLSSPTPALNLFQYQGLYESALHIRWPKYWSFSFNISPSNEHQGLISFRMDWLDLLAVQGTLKSLLQHHSSKHRFFWAHLSL